MTDIARRLAWKKAQDLIRISADDWPVALPSCDIGALHDGSKSTSSNAEALAALLDDEIAAGRLKAERIVRKEWPLIWAVDGDNQDWEISRDVISAEDVARVLGSLELGSLLRSWLAPYLQAETHQDEIAPVASQALTPMKRKGILDRFGRRYPALASALNRPEKWAKECRVPEEETPDGKRGWYYVESIEAACHARYGGTAAPAASVVDLSSAGQLYAARK